MCRFLEIRDNEGNGSIPATPAEDALFDLYAYENSRWPDALRGDERPDPGRSTPPAAGTQLHTTDVFATGVQGDASCEAKGGK
jgi:hypothetical protein